METQKEAQGAPSSNQKEARTRPKRSQDHLRLQNVYLSTNNFFAFINSRFLKVGGSVWEFKIVPERLQERIRNDFEEYQARRSEKKDNKNDNKATPLSEPLAADLRQTCGKPMGKNTWPQPSTYIVPTKTRSLRSSLSGKTVSKVNLCMYRQFGSVHTDPAQSNTYRPD